MTATLRTHSLVAAHPQRPPVLRGADITIDAGRRVALLGANGAGKSTLLRCLVGAMEPASGEITLDGTPLQRSRAGLREHRRRVQLVLQDPDDQLFSADVFQDVSFGPANLGLAPDEVRARVEEALEALGVAHLADRATHQLSYGERKRVATAGAVAMRPDVLLLDEPTAGLDPDGTDRVLDALARLHARETTMLVATHDMDFALAWADSVAVVVDGVVVQGEPTAILTDADLLARAHLRLPWAAVVARELGLDPAPRDRESLVAALAGGAR